MNATTQQNSVLNHDEIAKVASQLWQQEGRQSGRDQEYWLRAERQLRAIMQKGNSPSNNALMKRDASPATGKDSTRPPTVSAEPASTSAKRKRQSVKL